ncbi:hypothetical protein C0Q70_10185 [Pomacea canaliculata]|uniref:Uncharacterized protein n=1 Tax=Pomacea canaliculata TaxID=400727 RepID=A0A2T7PBX4_POMCA|nr:hypothetical protein C0Q70_10185 [Pomacea canaliculata]
MKQRKEDEEDQKDISLAFQLLPQDISKELLEMDIDEMQRKIIEIFKLNNCTIDLREAALADYYTSAVWWAKEQGFNEQQMSGFFTAVHTLLENIKEKHMTLVDNMKSLKQMLVGIGTEISTDFTKGGLDFLDLVQAQAIIKYITNSLFQHYRLYEYMFSNTQAEEIIGHEIQIAVPKAANLPFPPPLDEGIEEEVINLYLKEALPAPASTSDIWNMNLDYKIHLAESVCLNRRLQNLRKQTTQKHTINLESDIFSQLTAQDVQEVVESVAAEMLGNLQHEVAVKLQEKENAIITKINKVLKVA